MLFSVVSVVVTKYKKKANNIFEEHKFLRVFFAI